MQPVGEELHGDRSVKMLLIAVLVSKPAEEYINAKRTPATGIAALSTYRDAGPRGGSGLPAIVAVRAVIAQDVDQAALLAQATPFWRAREDLGHNEVIPALETAARHEWTNSERQRAAARANSVIHGTPVQVRDRLCALAEAHRVDEVMVNTLTSDPEHRRTSDPEHRRVSCGLLADALAASA